jgi:prepilin-type N-terminal cleavage/methylation domain-containing protein
MNSKGMTLIELIIVMALFGIIGFFTFQFIGSSVETYIMASNQAGLLAEAKPAIERMERDIRDAKSITSPAAGGSGNLITFTRTNATGYDSADESITFQLNGGTLEKVKQSPSVTSSMAGDVSAFTVTRAATDDEIKLELVLSLTGGEKVVLHTKVYPQNVPSKFNGDWKEAVQ